MMLLTLFHKIWYVSFQENHQKFYRKNPFSVNSMNVPYDYDSITHMSRWYLGKRDSRGNIMETIATLDRKKKYSIGQRSHLSQSDILQLNLLYRCPGNHFSVHQNVWLCIPWHNCLLSLHLNSYVDSLSVRLSSCVRNCLLHSMIEAVIIEVELILIQVSQDLQVHCHLHHQQLLQ